MSIAVYHIPELDTASAEVGPGKGAGWWQGASLQGALAAWRFRTRPRDLN